MLVKGWTTGVNPQSSSRDMPLSSRSFDAKRAGATKATRDPRESAGGVSNGLSMDSVGQRTLPF